MALRHFFLILTIILCDSCSNISRAQLQAIISPPFVYNSYQNSEELGIFTCVTLNSDDIRWIVNGYAHNHPTVQDEFNIRVSTVSYSNRSQHSVVKIPAIPINNRVDIECRAYNFNPWQLVSSDDTACYKIQGLLEPPSNVTYSSYNATHNLVEWLAPQTLDITNIEPDIDKYTLCITRNSAYSALTECVDTVTLQHIFPKYFFPQTVLITAWNIVGESDTSTPLVIEVCNNNTEFSLDNFQEQKNFVEVEFADINTTVFTISFARMLSHTLVDNCLYLYEVTLTHKHSEDHPHQPEEFPAVTHQLYAYYDLIVLSLSLPKDQLYTVNITRTTSSKQLALGPIDISTYDLQRVDVSMEGDLMTLTCHFAQGATTHNCTLLVASTNNTISLLRDLSLSDNSNCTMTQCFVDTVIDLSVLFTNGNITLRVTALDRRFNQTLSAQEVVAEITNSSLIITTPTSNITPALNTTTPNTVNNTTAPQATYSQQDSIGSENKTDMSVMMIAIIAAGGGGGALGTMCFIGISIVIVCVAYYKKLSKEKQKDKLSKCVPNAAYSTALELKQNEAYETTGSPLTPAPGVNMEQHTYEEIQSKYTHTKEPLYDVIGGPKEPAYAVIGDKPEPKYIVI